MLSRCHVRQGEKVRIFENIDAFFLATCRLDIYSVLFLTRVFDSHDIPLAVTCGSLEFSALGLVLGILPAITIFLCRANDEQARTSNSTGRALSRT
jgi:hypothetical protein